MLDSSPNLWTARLKRHEFQVCNSWSQVRERETVGARPVKANRKNIFMSLVINYETQILNMKIFGKAVLQEGQNLCS